MRTLAIYYGPQEYGNTYVTLVDLETGEPYKSITIPEGYENSGVEFIDNYYPNGKVVAKQKQELADCYNNSLNLCKEKNLKSIVKIIFLIC